MDAGIGRTGLPAHEVTKILEHVLREERRERRHHASHEDHHGTERLHGLKALLPALFTLRVANIQ